MIHFFKKVDPRIPITLSTGGRVEFTAVNRQTGIFATDNDDVARELDMAIKGNRGGASRITAEEHADLVQKKIPDPFKPKWRDEITNSGFRVPAESPNHNRPVAVPADQAEPARNIDGPDVSVNTVRPTATRPK